MKLTIFLVASIALVADSSKNYVKQAQCVIFETVKATKE